MSTNDRSVSDLACNALSIVLQHWLIPDLGWYPGIFQHRLPKLKEELLQTRLAVIPVHISSGNEAATSAGFGKTGEREKTRIENLLKPRLEKDEHLADIFDTHEIEHYLYHTPPQEMFPLDILPRITVSNTLLFVMPNIIDTFFHTYSQPHAPVTTDSTLYSHFLYFYIRNKIIVSDMEKNLMHLLVVTLQLLWKILWQ